MSIGETAANGVNHTPSGTDSGEENISEVLANAKSSDTREGFISHTPTPWHTDKYSAYIWGPAQEMVADSSMGDLPDNAVVRARGVGGKLPIKANMAFIVRAVNSHDDLLAALKLLTKETELSGNHQARDFGWPRAYAAARAAIAKAEGATP